MNEKKRWYKRKWFKVSVSIYAGLFVVAAIVGAIIGEDETPKSEAVAATSEVRAEEKAESIPPVKAVALSLEDAVNEYLGDRRTFGQSVENGYYMIKTDFGRFVGREFSEEESLELTQLVSEHPDYAATGANGVMVEFISGLTDAYGNSEDGTVMFVGYTNETIDRINFDNVDAENVVEIADEYFRVPAYK